VRSVYRTVRITTTGRRSGEPREIETWVWIAGEREFLTGPPGRRSWHANLAAEPRMTIDGAPAYGRVIRDPTERGQVFTALERPHWTADSPLVEVHKGAMATALTAFSAIEREPEALRDLCTPGFLATGLGPEPLDREAFIARELAYNAEHPGVRLDPRPVGTDGDAPLIRFMGSRLARCRVDGGRVARLDVLGA
jgi:hypothetical protein